MDDILLDLEVCIHVFLNVIIFEYLSFQNTSIFIFKNGSKYRMILYKIIVEDIVDCFIFCQHTSKT